MPTIRDFARVSMNPGEQFTGSISYITELGRTGDNISTFVATSKGNVSVSNLSDSDNIGTFTVTANDTPNSNGCIKFTMTSAATPATISKVEIHIKIRDRCN